MSLKVSNLSDRDLAIYEANKQYAAQIRKAVFAKYPNLKPVNVFTELRRGSTCRTKLYLVDSSYVKPVVKFIKSTFPTGVEVKSIKDFPGMSSIAILVKTPPSAQTFTPEQRLAAYKYASTRTDEGICITTGDFLYGSYGAAPWVGWRGCCGYLPELQSQGIVLGTWDYLQEFRRRRVLKTAIELVSRLITK